MSTPVIEKPKLGISACLMGAEVRFNGGHKESHLCTRALSQYFDFVQACPEVAIGMGIPREPIRLVGDAENPRALGTVIANLTSPRHWPITARRWPKNWAISAVTSSCRNLRRAVWSK